MDKVELAKYIAISVFAEKKDLAGLPYFEHLDRVASKFNDGILIQAAYLHDLLEDCPEWTIDHIKQLFHQNVALLLVLLTRQHGEDYFSYIRRIKSDYDAVRIKRADLEDNLNLLRLATKPELSNSDLKRIQKYHKALYILNFEKEVPNG